MRDITDRALDTAVSLGAGYADARVVRRLSESISIKTGRVEGVASGETEGFGVRELGKPAKVDATMAFMFETRDIIRPTAQALASPTLQPDYHACWAGIGKHFNPSKA